MIGSPNCLESLPEPWPEDLIPEIRKMIDEEERSVVVLDDDPTGTQTVHDLPVLMEWSRASLRRELERKTPVFYVLTNSRSLDEESARRLNREIGRRLREISAESGRQISVISRSDSTLRGHFPAEVDELVESLDRSGAVRILALCFFEGGRLTIDDVHYIEEAGQWTPVHETPFAGDTVFGYRHSNLKKWVEEKTRGVVRADQVCSISLTELRKGGPDLAAERLRALDPKQVCILNATCYRDLEVAVLAVLKAERRGQDFIFRTAASFVRVRAGLRDKGLLKTSDLPVEREHGGLIVVGSHVPKTTAQLGFLLENSEIPTVEIEVSALADEATWAEEVTRTSKQVNDLLADFTDVVVYTSRQVRSGRSAEENLRIGRKVSQGLVEIVRNCRYRPCFIVAKGGITSSDLATDGLRARRARVLGQIIPGVPVWKLGPESRFPAIPYVVFPGNVGSSSALLDVYLRLKSN